MEGVWLEIGKGDRDGNRMGIYKIISGVTLHMERMWKVEYLFFLRNSQVCESSD